MNITTPPPSPVFPRGMHAIGQLVLNDKENVVNRVRNYRQKKKSNGGSNGGGNTITQLILDKKGQLARPRSRSRQSDSEAKIRTIKTPDYEKSASDRIGRVIQPYRSKDDVDGDGGKVMTGDIYSQSFDLNAELRRVDGFNGVEGVLISPGWMTIDGEPCPPQKRVRFMLSKLRLHPSVMTKGIVFIWTEKTYISACVGAMKRIGFQLKETAVCIYLSPYNRVVVRERHGDDGGILQSNKMVLLFFRRASSKTESTLELRHQRSADVMFSIYNGNYRDVPRDTVFKMIETLLPDGFGGGKLVELFAPSELSHSGVGRRGWISVVNCTPSDREKEEEVQEDQVGHAADPDYMFDVPESIGLSPSLTPAQEDEDTNTPLRMPPNRSSLSLSLSSFSVVRPSKRALWLSPPTHTANEAKKPKVLETEKALEEAEPELFSSVSHLHNDITSNQNDTNINENDDDAVSDWAMSPLF